MFGCLFWSRARPAIALSIAAAILAVVAGINIWAFGASTGAVAGISVVGGVLVVLLRGAHAGFTNVS